jgi:hypothetical protein
MTTIAPKPAGIQDPARIVEEFLRIHMIPDPERARQYMVKDVKITFTGGRRFPEPRDCTAFNKKRYKWVKKKFERTDVCPVSGSDEVIVYQIGTLYGEWPDGTPFEGNRYVDRYVVRDGLIHQMDVWNDSAELLLLRAGIPQP